MLTKLSHHFWLLLINASLLIVLGCTTTHAQNESKGLPPTFGEVDQARSELENLVSRFHSDRRLFNRFYTRPRSSAEKQKFVEFLKGWMKTLESSDFDKLSRDGQNDYILLKNQIGRELEQSLFDSKVDQEIANLVSFQSTIYKLRADRRTVEEIKGEKIATILSNLVKEIKKIRESIKPKEVSKVVGNQAARRVDALKGVLWEWYSFYNGYDPLFTWWAKKPYEQVSKELGDYASWIRKEIIGQKNGEDPIIGQPLGEEALLKEISREFINYTPAQLVKIAEKEFDWCDREMLRASRELGFGEDWRKAMDHVKGLHVQPGEQPDLIKKLAHEAVDFLEERDLLTIPELCKQSWRVKMMSPQRQKVNPYFTGGEVITVSFPTDTMEHADKLMSLRGNNIHFSRATVHHELIPGHHLQLFMTERYMPYRGLFRTPFWVEGWALYWEMLLWDLNFQRSPEDRVGMLFWRRHRCARIIFSLNYHLKRWSAQECIEFLIERVGHERNNATAEVRRSVIGGYSPLYQAAYMLGGLQIRSLYKELVETGKIKARDFHDAILKENSIPIELIGAKLKNLPLSREFKSTWKFYGDVK